MDVSASFAPGVSSVRRRRDRTNTRRDFFRVEVGEAHAFNRPDYPVGFLFPQPGFLSL